MDRGLQRDMMTDANFADDEEAYEILTAAYAIAERYYVPNQGQGYFEDLLVRATIAICRRKYDVVT